MSVFDASKYVFQEVCDISLYDLVNKRLLVYLDQLQDSNFANEEGKSEAKGKNGSILALFKKDKKAKVTATSGEYSDGLLSLQTGSLVEKLISVPYPITEVLTVKDGKAFTQYTAVGDTGEEIVSLTINGNPDNYFEQDVAVSEGKFTYTSGTKEINFSEGEIGDGAEILVRYDAIGKEVKKITNRADAYAMTVRLEAKTKWLNVCDKKSYLFVLIMYQASVSGNFDVGSSGEPAVQKFEAEAVMGCGKKVLWDIFLVDEEDLI